MSLVLLPHRDWLPHEQESVVNRMLTERIDYRRKQDFQNADRIKDELKAMGVWVDDKAKTWRSDSIYGYKPKRLREQPPQQQFY